MPVTLPSFAKINIGLVIGPPGMRQDGFHELRTVYQTIALHDTLTISARHAEKTRIEITCGNARVPTDESNTCHKATKRVLAALRTSAEVTIKIDKQLPVQGGLGAASSNAVATILGLERALTSAKLSKKGLSLTDRLRIAEEVGSDVPLFLIGGTVAGMGRGEQVLPIPDLPELDIVVTTPALSIATPKAFRDWDLLFGNSGSKKAPQERPELTVEGQSDKLNGFSREVYAWLGKTYFSATSGVPARSGNRAEALLLDLVRTGIENDFEHVVFPQFPELSVVKRAIEREGASYASLSGSGSAVYGLFASRAAAVKAAKGLKARGIEAQAAKTVSREQYWKAFAKI